MELIQPTNMNWVQGWGAWGGEEVESPKGPSGSLTIRSLGTGKVNGPTHICPTVSRSPAVAQITSLCFRFRQVSRSLARVRLAFSSRTARVKLTHVRFTLRSLGTGKVNGPTHICPTVSRSPAVAQITSLCFRFRQVSRSLARVRLAFSSRSARVFGLAQLAPVGSGSEGVSTEQSASFKIATCRQQVQGSCGCAVQESGVVGVKRRSSQTLCILSHFHVHTPWPACVDKHRPVVMEGNED